MKGNRIMKIYLTNLGRYNEGYLIGKWVKLPVEEKMLNEVLEAIGINEYYEEYFISDVEENDKFIGLSEVVSEYSSVQALNKLAQRLEELSDEETDKLGAVLEYEACRSVSDVLELIDKLDEFDLLTDVNDDEALGYYYAEEYCCIDIPEHIKPFFDFEKFGRTVRFQSSCLFTTYGFLLDNR